MGDAGSSYPLVEPSNFDLIVVGTGIPESIIASAASAAGKKVIQLDPNQFYGHHYASLAIDGLVSFLRSQSRVLSHPINVSDDYSAVPLVNRPLYSELEINSYSSDPPIEDSGKFNLDLVGPRAFLCSDKMIDLILNTGVHNYMEFKSVEASFMSDVTGKLVYVPDSRSAIFKDRTLSLTEKNQLMKFFKLVQGHFSENAEDKISEEDLDSTFLEFLSKVGLSEKLKSFILYAIVQANYDQAATGICRDLIYTKTGIDRLARYHSSIGRFPNANSAMLYPMYGHVELPQAFCRRAAVKGGICGLGMATAAVLMDKDNGLYRGVQLASGQQIFSPQLILPPSLSITSHLSDAAHSREREKAKVARGICIARASIRPDTDNCVVFFPPRSLHPEQITCVRVLQLSSSMAVCPSGMFVSYLSTICDEDEEGKRLLNAAINALFFDDFSNCIGFATMPDEHLQYGELLDVTEKLFRKLYPDDEFVLSTTSDDDPTSGGDASSELDQINE
ncbi:hypothetical protein M569_00553 [Genlisea aurea]|uniref:Rab proteins geranylgeranyltransferase component n=1 Tax=Genlisea aurea TaxID=192259 RepID=S8D461_9LAMI|nr:hypothetical protein M569_00553 [Genlisea aurea]